MDRKTTAKTGNSTLEVTMPTVMSAGGNGHTLNARAMDIGRIAKVLKTGDTKIRESLCV